MTEGTKGLWSLGSPGRSKQNPANRLIWRGFRWLRGLDLDFDCLPSWRGYQGCLRGQDLDFIDSTAPMS